MNISPFNVSDSITDSKQETLTDFLPCQRGKKKNPPPLAAALLIGINYVGLDAELKGCINDVNKMKDFLVTKLLFPSSNITVLTDDATDDSLKPTRENILRELALITQKAANEKLRHVWVHYSGHGSYEFDMGGDEKDYYDEVIVPVDYETSGFIKDDKLYDVFTKNLPKSTKATILMDCCHSGSILDLKYRKQPSGESIVENSKYKTNNNIVCISGCKDSQTSADAYNLAKQKKWSGAMTWAFLKSMEQSNYDIKYRSLLKKMRQHLKQKGFSQKPQLSCSKDIDLDQKFTKKRFHQNKGALIRA